VSAPARLSVRIDRKVCVGTSNCAEEAPRAYEMDDRASPHARPGATDDDILRGAEACPVGAITVFDPTTGKQVYP